MTVEKAAPYLSNAADAAPVLAVVIPAFGRDSGIVACLDALDRQDFAQPFEVVVVDNCGCVSPEVPLERFSRVRLVHERRAGSYAARNRGVEEARGAIVAFCRLFAPAPAAAG